VRENRTPGLVQGAPGNRSPYCNAFAMTTQADWLVETAEQLAKLSFTPTEDFENIKEEFWSLYDRCLWETLTASEDQLVRVFNQSWAYDLPAPMHTAICQRLALISRNADIKRQAIACAKMYGDPVEGEHMALGVSHES
jgi:hypothetical protein